MADRLETVGHRYRVHVLEAVHDTYLAASWPALLAPADVADPLATDADVAREVALVALHLRDDFETRRIRRQPPLDDAVVRWTFGIHVGPVAGGLIGLDRPHYHLFGDAVNVASRMSTTGEPGRIQITHECHQLLAGHFDVVERGDVHVKGKGVLKTFWLQAAK